jgi:DNA-binding NtrC family response regulator
VLPLRLPALRERTEDIPALARRLLSPGVALAASADKALAAYPWPGNVRELRNVLERAQVVSRKKTLEAGDLHLSEHEAAADEDKLTLADVERRHIERVLRSEKGKVARAADVLGIAKSSLYEKLRRFAIDAGTEAEP